jgi:hypothetical protein
MSSEGPTTSPADSRQDGSASDASRPSDDPQVLREEIERTREQLGATVEALAAKADVKAQAQQKVSQLTGRLTTKADQARQQAAARSGRIQRQLADKTAKPRRKVFAMIGPAIGSAKDQVRQRAAVAATSISKVTPEPVKQAAGNAAATARRRRGPLAAAGAIVAAVLGWLLINRRRRR